MTENQTTTLRSLVELGLDLTTGTSPEVSIKVLEAHSGIRQTSNGSRIIRRDSKVFSLFNIKWDYEISSGNLLNITFLGYKTGDDIRKQLKDDYIRYSEKVHRFQGLLRDTSKFLEWTENNKVEDLSIEDLARML